MRDGDRVVLLIGSANRDERVFPDPDRFDLGATPARMLSFGHGTHFCLGASLARLEGRVALEEVQARLPDYEIDAARHRARPLGQRARLRRVADHVHAGREGCSEPASEPRTAVVTGASSGIGDSVPPQPTATGTSSGASPRWSRSVVPV